MPDSFPADSFPADSFPADSFPADSFLAETTVAIGAVRQGLALAQRGAPADIYGKQGRDIVTSTDIAVEDLLRKVIGDGTGLPIVGEEHGGEAPSDGSAYWLVDPICGTRNFASGTSLYSINVALAEEGQVTAAVVGDPSAGEVLVAEAGRGAWALTVAGSLRRLQATDSSQTVAPEAGRSAGSRRDLAATFIAAVIRADRWEVRSLGTTLALPYVAAGKLSAWAVFWTDSAVHCAAGSLLVAEAGGIVSDLDGAAWTTASDSCLASAHAGLHRELLELLH